MMLMHNDADTYYFEKVVSNTVNIVDKLYCLDDHSTDSTFSIAQKYTPYVYHAKNTWAIGELDLRKELLDIILTNENPNWLIQVDSDDLHCGNRLEFNNLMEQNYNWISFEWYNMWENEDYYRVPVGVAPRMFNINCVEDLIWSNQKYHVNLPQNVLALDGFCSQLKIKHLGQINNDTIREKYSRKTTIEDPSRTLFDDGVYDDYLKNDHEIKRWEHNNE